jgi:amino acid adenylation domain-containing protein/thioester reductase-like protein
LFLAALAMYINRITSKNDIVIGTPVLNRSNRKDKNTTGMFINTLPMRINIDSDTNFKTFSNNVSMECMPLFRHQKYPYDLLLKNIRAKYSNSENLYDIVLSYQNSKMEKQVIDDQYMSRWHFNHHQVNSLTIHINDRDDDGRLIIDYDFHEDMYSVKEIEFLHTHMLSLLWHALDNPEKNINKIEMLPESEKIKVLYEFNNTKADYPKDKTIHQLFEEQVQETPNKIAIIFEDKEILYKDLNLKANQLAWELREIGVMPNSIVGIMVSRSFELIIGILAILKAGGAYLPIDPEYPKDRIEYILENSKASVLLTEEKYYDTINYKGNIILADKKSNYKESNSINPASINSPTDLAYVIYTSGSTGKPKGVMIEHRAVNNFVTGVSERIDFLNKTILSLTTVSFDIFVLETILPLVCGTKIVLANEKQQKMPQLISEAIKSNGVNMLQATPSRIQMILNDESASYALSYLSDLMIGGEALPHHILLKLKQNINTRIYNLYGPTETTVWSTIKDLTGSSEVDIGTPISNTQIYILDKYMNLVPIGVEGELYIGGVGLARGYVYNSELTAEKFIPNPFMEGEKIYKTGDLARWFPKGDIEFLGRIDHQIKLRGFRIELGEIEHHLLSYPSITKAVVIDNGAEEDSQKYLCAYYVSDKEILINDLKKHLAKNLPYYMIPTYYMKIDAIPLTPNGKIDRKALPKIEKDKVMKTRYRKPETEVEKKLAKMWKDILNIKRISKDSNFFELGGDSLNVITLLNQIHKSFNVELTFDNISEMPTLTEMSAHIDSTKRNAFTPIPVAEKREHYPLLASQKRIYILSSMENESLNYNMPFALELDGQADEKKISEIFYKLIERHEALRTSFNVVNGEPVQIIHDNVSFSISFEDCTEEGINSFIKKHIRPFKLDKAPLLRVSIAKLSNNKRIMFMDMHHIISDGISVITLLNEFSSLYDDNTLPTPTVCYKDYVVWKNSIDLSSQKEYWMQVYNDEVPVADLHYDFERPLTQSYYGKKLHFTINKTLSKKINKVVKNNGTTAFTLMFAAYNILLSKYSGQEDIIVGIPVAGRRHPDIDKMIGMFVNTVALRNKPFGKKTFIEFLAEVRDNSFKAFENQDYPFEELVSNLKIPRNLNRNPLFDTMFIYQKVNSPHFENKEIHIAQYQFDSDISKFDISLEITDMAGEFSFTIEYCTDLFKHDTIQRMGEHYLNILKSVTDSVEIKISEIEMLTSYEKNMILHVFNDTSVNFQREKTIHQLFEEQAEKTPDAIAIVFEGNKYTYKQLNEASNKLALYLREKYIAPNKIVGIMVNRSFEMMVGILAVLKAGGCYLPIDPAYPEERIDYILKDSGAKIVLTQEEHKSKILSNQEIIDIYDDEITNYPTGNLTNINKGEDLAYVIYTSGSTGNPKGVMIRHSSVINLINGITNKIDFSNNKSIVCITTICFDIFVLESILPLCRGLKIIIANQEESTNPNLLKLLIQRHRVNMLQSTPTRLNLFINQDDFISCLDNLSEIMVGGESLPRKLLKKLKKVTNAKIYNMYGPTETTVWSTIKMLNDPNTITIGYPIDNTQIYIMDKNRNLLPLGIKGELFIGGEGLARGYLNRDDLTHDKFIKNPLKDNDIIYNTGDIARWLPNGDIELFGRNDHQVKIRGYRIETGEIEKKLIDIPQIKEAAVVDFEIDDNKYLCGFFVVKQNNNITIKKIKTILHKKLPEYMIPSDFVKVEKIPLTQNGKIDRKNLLVLSKRKRNKSPINTIEKTLIELWRKTLNKEDISVFDNFFEIGGDSLSILQIQIELIKYNWNIKTQDFYRFQTIKELSEYIKNVEVNYSINDSHNYVNLNNSFNIQLELKEKNIMNFKHGKSVLITGATGFLGIHILKRFIEDGEIDIYCIIRRKSKENAKNYLLNQIKKYFEYEYINLPTDRIHVIYGDITKENYGLTDIEYKELGRVVSFVIHSAANVRHYGNYDDFYNTNIKGTETVANFCLENNLFLYHISTMSVSGSHLLNKNLYFDKFTEKHFFIGQNYYDNVYVRSKFEAERIIYEAMTKGLTASVIRVGNLTGRYSDGHLQINTQDNAFLNRIKTIMQIKVIPDTILDMEMEFTPVDYCSDAIYKIIQYENRKEIVYHLYNHNTINVCNFILILYNMGLKINVVKKEQFNQVIQNIKKKKINLDALSGLYDYLNNDKKNNRIQENIVLSSEQTIKILKELDFLWPSVDREYLSKIIKQIDISKTKGILHE